jgi:hypothetical protein
LSLRSASHRLTASLLGAALSLSCDTTGPGEASEYFIRYRANGSAIEYREDLRLHGVVGMVGSQHALALEGESPAGAPAESSLNVSVFDVVPITTRTYTGYQTVTGGFTSAGLIYRAGGVEYHSNLDDADNRVTITEIARTHLRGTFSGTLKLAGRPDVVITNGEFYVPTHVQ